MAHDFNNVLTAQAASHLPSYHPVHTELDLIRSAGGRASGLTRQLLAFGRNQPIHLRTVDINALVRETERLLRPVIGEQFASRCSPSCLPCTSIRGSSSRYC